MKIGKGSCNGTFGELVQGVLGERPFLVTLPVHDLKSEATFIPNPDTLQIVGPVGKTKAVTACKKLLQLFQIHCGGTLIIESNILEGKGMASSSADIVASLRALADSFDLIITEEMISKIATGIEPTDGVMYPEVVSYDYINGELIEKFDKVPELNIIGIDFGGTVDTVTFNKKQKRYSESDKKRLLVAYQLIKSGIENKDLSSIFEASTISAEINQKLLPKPYFLEFMKLIKEYGCGLVVAHSGTVLGILTDNEQKKEELSEIINDRLFTGQNSNKYQSLFFLQT